MDMSGIIVILVIVWTLSVLGGVLLGMIPFFVGKSKGKQKLGEMGWLWTAVGGVLGLQIPALIVFLVLILKNDGGQTPAVEPVPASRTASMALSCLSGPMKGRTYHIAESGIMIGRDNDCAVRFDADTPGISRHHCELRFAQGTLMLTDLNSAYGTYLADGSKLPPQYPTQMYVGSRFYLSDKNNMFQIILTV